MRLRSPSSRGYLRVRLSVFDTLWAFVCPYLALQFRDATILSVDTVYAALFYCLISAGFSLLAFLTFNLRDGIGRFFSFHEALDVVKAVAFGELLTCGVIFMFTRLEGVPRSIPFIHVLLLAAGLLAVRTFIRVYETERKLPERPRQSGTECIIMIGSNRLSSLYIKFLEAYFPHQHRVVAVLDDRRSSTGRSLCGIKVVGAPHQLEPIVNEYAEHGIQIDRVIVGGEPDLLSEEALQEIQTVCREREMRLDFVPRLVGLGPAPVKSSPVVSEIRVPTAPSSFALPHYFVAKRYIELCVALAMIIAFLPLFAIAAGLALLDVGSPVLFWQQRMGFGGRTFLLQKIRTLRPPFDWQGKPIAEHRRLSWIGFLIRKTRLDELPQLLNVIVGNMSLIGPRPLLPKDQPANPHVRLSIRPGITGWAQVNGGKLLNAIEKNSLDEWYIRNASLWLDLRILFLTALCMLRGEQRSESALAQASGAQTAAADLETQAQPLPVGLSRLNGHGYGHVNGHVNAHANGHAAAHGNGHADEHGNGLNGHGNGHDANGAMIGTKDPGRALPINPESNVSPRGQLSVDEPS